MGDFDAIEKRMMEKGWLDAPKPTQDFAVAEPGIPAAETGDYEAAAAEDVKEINSLRGKFATAAKRHSVPPELLAGIASRESRAGKHLNEYGYDEAKKAFGVMQVDERFHKLEGKEAPNSQGHINQAAAILQANKKMMDKMHPDWTEDQRWRGAAAAYNMGPGNVKTLEHMDAGTTGNNYSEDVTLRARYYRQLWSKKK